MADRRGCSSQHSMGPMSLYQNQEEMLAMLEEVRTYRLTVLGHTTLRSISLRLDQDSEHRRSWVRLAELMGFQNFEIAKFKQCSQYPTEEVMKNGSLRNSYTIGTIIDLVHNQLGRRDIFTDEEVVGYILSDVERHQRGRGGVRRSCSQQEFYPPPLLPASRFRHLNTASIPPSYSPSAFSGLNSQWYAYSALYAPGQGRESAIPEQLRRSLGTRGLAVENECVEQIVDVAIDRTLYQGAPANVCDRHDDDSWKANKIRRGNSLPCEAWVGFEDIARTFPTFWSMQTAGCKHGGLSQPRLNCPN